MFATSFAPIALLDIYGSRKTTNSEWILFVLFCGSKGESAKFINLNFMIFIVFCSYYHCDTFVSCLDLYTVNEYFTLFYFHL